MSIQGAFATIRLRLIAIKRERINAPPTYDFREVYQNAEESRDDLTRLVKIAHQQFLAGNAIEVDLNESRSRATDTREGSSQSKAGVDAVPDDRKYLELERTFAIVIIPPDDDPAYAVWLMNLDETGEIDFGHEEFVLAQTATRDAALNYAVKLSNLLKLRVLELAKT